MCHKSRALFKVLGLSAGIGFQLLTLAADETVYGKRTNLSGIVRDAFLDELDAHYHFFVIQNESGMHYATTKSPSVDQEYVNGLIGAEVTIKGIVDPASPPNRQYLGQTVFFDGTNALQVLTPAPQNPFAVPEIEDFNFYNYGPESIVQGTESEILHKGGPDKITVPENAKRRFRISLRNVSKIFN